MQARKTTAARRSPSRRPQSSARRQKKRVYSSTCPPCYQTRAHRSLAAQPQPGRSATVPAAVHPNPPSPPNCPDPPPDHQRQSQSTSQHPAPANRETQRTQRRVHAACSLRPPRRHRSDRLTPSPAPRWNGYAATRTRSSCRRAGNGPRVPRERSSYLTIRRHGHRRSLLPRPGSWTCWLIGMDGRGRGWLLGRSIGGVLLSAAKRSGTCRRRD